MFSVWYTYKGFSTTFRVTETYKTHAGGQVGGGVGLTVGVLCVSFHPQREISGAKSHDPFIIRKERSLSNNTATRSVTKDKQHEIRMERS